MKIIVTGANGQLGSDICEVLRNEGHEVIEWIHEKVDITDSLLTKQLLLEINPQVLINPAAYHHVDKCQGNPDMAFKVNATAPANLAQVCKQIDALFIHISTDYVFDGQKQAPYIETDCANPLNNYGISKLAGEKMILNSGCKSAVVRTSGLYGLNSCRAKGGKNFIELMLSLAEAGKPIRVVDDERVSPTYTKDLAFQISRLLNIKNSEIFHATAEGSCSWYEFAKTIFQLKNISANLNIANPSEFVAKVNRPKYSVLENYNIKKLGVNVMREWQQALDEYLSVRK